MYEECVFVEQCQRDEINDKSATHDVGLISNDCPDSFITKALNIGIVKSNKTKNHVLNFRHPHSC